MQEIGYGAGNKDFDFPNVLRVIQFQDNQQSSHDKVQVIECQIDDMTPEMLGHFMDTSLYHGALDVYYTPITMKKNRPAIQLTVLCKVNDKETMENLVLTHTSSLGVRSYTVNRHILTRAFRDVDTPYGQIKVKFALKNGQILKMKPEFEDIKSISEHKNIPLQQVYNTVMSTIDSEYHIGEPLK